MKTFRQRIDLFIMVFKTRLHRACLLCLALSSLCVPVSLLGQSIAFEDVSLEAGVSTSEPAHGIAVADFNNDGWDDIFIGAENGGSVLLANQKDGTFADVAEELGVQIDGTVFNPLWGDINNDGYLDLFLGKFKGEVTCQLFIGSAQGTFTEITPFSGIGISDEIGSATFGDYNMDGRLDLFIATRGSEDYLFENVYDGSTPYFKDITGRAGVGGDSIALPMQATWVDYDNDFDVDLFAVHDGNLESRFYQNNSFLPLIEVSSLSNLQVARSSMGVAWGDYDNDGWQDAYITNIDQGNLFRNLGNGRFEDVTIQSGSGRNGMSWGVVFVDFDNDGDQDLFIGNTYDFDGRRSFLYENDNSSFFNIAREAGVSLSTNTFGVATGDFDKDGYMDLVVGDDTGENKLLFNRSERGKNWIHLTLEGDTFNRMGVGAMVQVYAQGALYVRSLYAGSSYRSQVSPTLHFGLDDAPVIDSLLVHWGPASSELYLDLPVNKEYKITQNIPLSVDIELPSEDSATLLEISHFPNPFSNTTTFQISLPESEYVKLDIYDVTGRKVETLLERVLPAGSHQIHFYAEAYPRGIFFYRFSNSSSVRTGKLVIVN